jgi:hypothetical protein
MEEALGELTWKKGERGTEYVVARGDLWKPRSPGSGKRNGDVTAGVRIRALGVDEENRPFAVAKSIAGRAVERKILLATLCGAYYLAEGPKTTRAPLLSAPASSGQLPKPPPSRPPASPEILVGSLIANAERLAKGGALLAEELPAMETKALALSLAAEGEGKCDPTKLRRFLVADLLSIRGTLRALDDAAKKALDAIDAGKERS